VERRPDEAGSGADGDPGELIPNDAARIFRAACLMWM